MATGPRVVVIGAGVLGACCAWQLAKRAARVTVLERGRPAQGASGTSFAWVGSSYQDVIERPRYFALKQESGPARSRLREELGGPPWLHRTGSLIWSEDVEEAAALERGLRRLEELGLEVELCSPSRAQELEPLLRVAPEVELVGHLPGDGYVSARTLVEQLLVRSQALGALVRTGTEVTEILASGDRVSGVRSAAGETFPADQVVLAAGTGTARLAAGVGARIPLIKPDRLGSDAVGLIVATRRRQSELGRLVVNDQVMYRPDGEGRLVLHSYPVDRQVTPQDSPAELLKRGREVAQLTARSLLSPRPLELEWARVGVRPLPQDGVSVVGRLGPCPGVYAAVTHSAITLAPLLGELVADELLGASPAAILEPFGPERFSVPAAGEAAT